MIIHAFHQRDSLPSSSIYFHSLPFTRITSLHCTSLHFNPHSSLPSTFWLMSLHWQFRYGRVVDMKCCNKQMSGVLSFESKWSLCVSHPYPVSSTRDTSHGTTHAACVCLIHILLLWNQGHFPWYNPSSLCVSHPYPTSLEPGTLPMVQPTQPVCVSSISYFSRTRRSEEHTTQHQSHK
jgi:hypothetical protein